MRLKRILAVLCVACYMISGAYAANILYTESSSVELEDNAVDVFAKKMDSTAEMEAVDATAEQQTTKSVEQEKQAQPRVPAVYAAAPKVSASTHKIMVDGIPVSPQVYNIDGYNFFKLRDVAYLLRSTEAAFNVEWNEKTNDVYLVSKTDYVPVGGELTVTPAASLHVKPSVSKILLDNNGVSVKGYIINGNNYYKIADLASAIGFIAAFDNATHTVQIKTAAAPTPRPEPEPEPEPQPKPEKPFVTGVYKVRVNDYLRIRSGPGPEHAVVGKFVNDATVVIDRVTNGWAHIRTGPGKGDRYCSINYLVRVGDFEDETDKPQPEPKPDLRPERVSNIDGVKTIIIDPGHGGSDIGAHSQDKMVDEKHINLDVSLYLQQYLEDAGFRVIMVRDTLEDGSNLSQRKTVMEEYVDSVDLFFSVHHNAANTAARGAEALAQVADRNGGPSKLIGELLLEEYGKLGMPIRKVVFKENGRGDDYYYTNRVAFSLGIPAVTSEFCFVDNEEDITFVDSDEDLRAEAEAQFRAITRYFEQVVY